MATPERKSNISLHFDYVGTGEKPEIEYIIVTDAPEPLTQQSLEVTVLEVVKHMGSVLVNEGIMPQSPPDASANGNQDGNTPR
jgi:hypothetical protein